MAHPNFSDKSTTKNPPKLLDQVRDKLRVKHYSIRTEHTYADWIKRYILFHGKRHPKDLRARDWYAPVEFSGAVQHAGMGFAPRCGSICCAPRAGAVPGLKSEQLTRNSFRTYFDPCSSLSLAYHSAPPTPVRSGGQAVPHRQAAARLEPGLQLRQEAQPGRWFFPACAAQ